MLLSFYLTLYSQAPIITAHKVKIPKKIILGFMLYPVLFGIFTAAPTQTIAIQIRMSFIFRVYSKDDSKTRKVGKRA
ncbi:hypothetical protein JYT21_00465 [bacterium AH-315-B15]|nr:hypothetical protein [bacterium AH-315-B15]